MLKTLIPSNKPFRVKVYNRRFKHSNKTVQNGDCKSNQRYEGKDYTKDVTFIPFIPVLHAANSALKLRVSVSRSLARPAKLLVTWPPILTYVNLT